MCQVTQKSMYKAWNIHGLKNKISGLQTGNTLLIKLIYSNLTGKDQLKDKITTHLVDKLIY